MNNPEEANEYMDAASPANLEQEVRDIKEKERVLNQRTEMLENMMRTLTGILSGLRPPEPSTSMPNDQTPTSVPPPLNFSTPGHSNIGIAGSPIGASPPFVSSSPYPKSYLRDALELVPKYDGHNIPVWQFARACKRAKETVPLVDEAQFVRMLRNKLSHHAYLAVEDEVHLTLNKFLDTLKKIFGPGRSSNFYRGQLSIAYKKPTEHVLDYIGRIKDLRTAIIEGDQTNLDRSLTEVELSSINSFVLEAFYEGLPREYRIELCAEGYTDFSDACSKVITIGKRLEREELRNRGSRNPRDNSSPQPKILQRDSPVANQNPPSPSASDMGARKICSFCKSFGHLVNECRKRQYFDNQGNNNYQNRVNYNSSSANLNTNTSYNSPTNNVANNRYTSRSAGNGVQASANGTPRGLAIPRPVHSLEGNPAPSTSSEETMETFPQSSSIQIHSEPTLHSCSTLEPSQIS